MKPHTKLLLALVAGFAAGAAAHAYGSSPAVDFLGQQILRPVGQIFLRVIFMTVVPMVFAALVIGVYELGREHGLGGVAARTLAFTLLLSAVSVIVGMLLVNVVRPGANLPIRPDAASAGVTTLESNAAAAKPLGDVLIELIPRNPLDSAVRALDGEMLPLMVFALIFGFAISRAPAGEGERNILVRVFDQIFDACMRIVGWAMVIAPLAVFAIVFNTARTFGGDVFRAVLLYVVTVVVGLLIQQFIVYSAVLRVAARRSPIQFFRDCREVYLYAFSTASSNATLPVSLKTAETKLGISPRIARFVLTVGSTANQNGTALFEGVTLLFLAQVYGLDLTVGQQVRVMVMSIVAGIGTAGVPGGSLPMVLIVAQSVGIPAEGMGLILGVDRFLDMCRTAVNVSGDLVIATVVDKSQVSTFK
ncbi:MAG TPA: dicarboxylate/amino acid:cation symporter [Vicinamibacterales bacterium]|nr:dicarboxylate/amino acid:cation symporter [Vicinamibacterales bacterium]